MSTGGYKEPNHDEIDIPNVAPTSRLGLATSSAELRTSAESKVTATEPGISGQTPASDNEDDSRQLDISTRFSGVWETKEDKPAGFKSGAKSVGENVFEEGEMGEDLEDRTTSLSGDMGSARTEPLSLGVGEGFFITSYPSNLVEDRSGSTQDTTALKPFRSEGRNSSLDFHIIDLLSIPSKTPSDFDGSFQNNFSGVTRSTGGSKEFFVNPAPSVPTSTVAAKSPPESRNDGDVFFPEELTCDMICDSCYGDSFTSGDKQIDREHVDKQTSKEHHNKQTSKECANKQTSKECADEHTTTEHPDSTISNSYSDVFTEDDGGQTVPGGADTPRCATWGKHTGKFSCSCHTSCLIYGDCCPNVFEKCFRARNESDLLDRILAEEARREAWPFTGNLPHDQELARDTGQSKQLVDFYNTQFGQCVGTGYTSYQIVSRCPSGHLDNVVREMCEHQTNPLLPIVSFQQRSFHLVFRNVHCAACHGIEKSELTVWKSEITCEKDVVPESAPPTLAKIKEYVKDKLCTMAHGEPPEVCSPRSCRPESSLAVVDRNVLREQVRTGNCSQLDAVLCRAYILPSGTYKNPHCEMCQSPNRTKDKIGAVDVLALPSCTTNKEYIAGPSFDVPSGPRGILLVLDITGQYSSEKGQSHVQGYLCEDDQVFEPLTQTCIQRFCSPGFEPYRGQCVPSNVQTMVPKDTQYFPDGWSSVKLSFVLDESRAESPLHCWSKEIEEMFASQNSHTAPGLENIIILRYVTEMQSDFKNLQRTAKNLHTDIEDAFTEFKELQTDFAALQNDETELMENLREMERNVEVFLQTLKELHKNSKDLRNELQRSLGTTTTATTDEYPCLEKELLMPEVSNNGPSVHQPAAVTVEVTIAVNTDKAGSLNNLRYAVSELAKYSDRSRRVLSVSFTNVIHRAETVCPFNGHPRNLRNPDIQTIKGKQYALENTTQGGIYFPLEHIGFSVKLDHYISHLGTFNSSQDTFTICESNLFNNTECVVVSYWLNQTAINGTSLVVLQTGDIYTEGNFELVDDKAFVCSDLTFGAGVDTDGFSLTFNIISLTATSLSILALFVMLLIYGKFSELRNLPGKMTANLAGCMMTMYILNMFTYFDIHNDYVCPVFAALHHLFALASYAWMSAIAVNMALTFGARVSNPLDALSSNALFIRFSAVVWTVSVSIVMTSLLLDITHPDDVTVEGSEHEDDSNDVQSTEKWNVNTTDMNEENSTTQAMNIIQTHPQQPSEPRFPRYGHPICFWFSAPLWARLTFIIGPYALSFIVNVVAFTITLVSINKASKASEKICKKSSDRLTCIIYLKLSTAMGFTWILATLLPVFPSSRVLEIVYSLLVLLQGLLLVLAFMGNRRVWNLLVACFKARRASSSTGYTSTRSSGETMITD
ncbi:uncharacterized protein LOC118478778 [Aplysia californica]|uniref:Uncharacterized protein LOC118478778 n=1 Tax=Aplysia californica TaxID=6500 RepID=A0ABM1W2H6_APLCA|nr:uncharacterized protein LOC118478778 [Aplysia californica]